jgi:hypothetical protein
MMNIKKLTLTIFLFCTLVCSVFAIPPVPNVKSSSSTLFLEKAEQVKEMQTVTYFFTEQSIPNDIKNAFKQFADKIGATHGAVIINKKSSEYLDYSKLMKCDITISSSDLIIFENRKLKKCK